jgi:hypothetical protein
LFERVEVELYPLGGEISKRISADAKRAGLTADRMVQAVLERKASLDKHTPGAAPAASPMVSPVASAGR